MFNQWEICDSICLLFTFIFLIFYVSIFFNNNDNKNKYLNTKIIVMCSVFGPIFLFFIIKYSIISIRKKIKSKENDIDKEKDIDVSELNILN